MTKQNKEHMKPKTLKDLDWMQQYDDEDEFTKRDEGGFYKEVVDRNELKQEAIKWIKYFEKCESPKKCPFYIETGTEDICETFCSDIIKFLKHFFNITKKDLK